MKKIITIIIFNVLAVFVYSQTYSSFKTFKDLPQGTFWNGSDLTGGFIDGIIDFPCYYDTSYGGYWSSGWAVSTMKDDSTSGTANLYGIRTKARIDDSPFSIGQNHSFFNTYDGEEVLFEGLYITNTTYAYLSMKNGDSFAKKFGGETGQDPDYFKIRIYAMHGNSIDSTNFVDFYLADFRFSEDTLDYIVDEWWYVDLSSLGYIDGLSFELSSSDNGQWGMNTPAFFAVDKIKYSYKVDYDSGLTVSFEEMQLSLDSFWIGKGDYKYFYDNGFEFPSVYDTSQGGFWSGGFALSSIRDDITGDFTNLYGAIPGGSFDGITYVVGQNNVSFNSNWADAYPVIKNIKITNTTYAYYSMKNGDIFAKKFGGDTGYDPDYFRLRIYAKSIEEENFDSLNYYDFYLADYRFDDNANDYIIDDWTDINIDSIFDFEVSSLSFELSSSDNGPYGMNTPAFFAMDRIEFDLISGNEVIGQKLSLIDVYPNPAVDFIKLDLRENIVDAKYEIYDLNGVLRKKGVLNGGIIDISILNKGFYLIKVELDNYQYLAKINKI